MTHPMTFTSVGRATMLLTATLGVASGALAQDAANRFSSGVNVTLGWEDNIALTSVEDEKFDVTTTLVELNLGYQLTERADRGFGISATPFYQYVSDVSDLSNYGVRFGADLDGAFGTAFTDPWYSIDLDYTVAWFEDSDPRDGSWLDLELGLGKEFTPLFGMSVGYRYHQRWQRDETPECITGGCDAQFNWQIGDVFDLERHGAFVNGELRPNELTSLFVEYTYWDGDVAVSGRPAVPNATVTDDLALGGFGANGEYRVWRADAQQNVVEAGISRAFSERLNVGLNAFYLWTDGVNNEISEDDYENTGLSLSVELGF